jgi:hypothetical protein
LLARCNYTEAIWNLIANLFNLHGYSQISLSGGGGGASQGIEAPPFKGKGTRENKRGEMGILLDFWWAIWKERNRIVFENKDRSPQQLVYFLKDEITLHLAVLRQSRHPHD